MLRDVSVKVGFELTDYGIPDKDLTVSVEDSTVEELVRQLLRGEKFRRWSTGKKTGRSARSCF